MPTYEYHCEACAHSFDEFHSMSAEPLKKCPSCGKKKLRRAFGTGAAVLFKGSGFYETDYRSDSYKKAAQAESGGTGEKGGAEGGSGKGEGTAKAEGNSGGGEKSPKSDP